MKNKYSIVLAIIVVVGGGIYFLRTPADNASPQLGLVAQNTPAGTQPIQGLQIQVMREGTGNAAQVGDTVSVHYTGMFPDGRKFDSSRDRATPFSFQLGAGQVIQGWEQGIVGMKVGEQRHLVIAPELGYGATGAFGVIPANATLVFDIELLSVTRETAAP